MPKFIDLTGKKFGRLHVLYKDVEISDKRIRWIVKCTFCNLIFSVRSNNLISRKTERCIQCKQTPSENELLNKQIGEFKVLKFDGFYGNPKSGWWIVQHNNGLIKKVKTSSLNNKRSLTKIFKTDIDSSISVLYRKYKDAARKRNLNFELDINEFSKLIFNNCHYCGSAPSNIQKSKNVKKTPLKYNGIDRMNNLYGYIKTNVVTCCIVCNRGKSNLEYNEWINYLQNLVNNFKM